MRIVIVGAGQAGGCAGDTLRDGRGRVTGGGRSGLTAAGAASKMGCAVPVVGAADRLWGRVLPDSVSHHLQDLHPRHGVDIRLNAASADFAGDTVVVGIGITP